MANSISQISVDFTANVAKFSEGLKEMNRQTKNWQKGVQQTVSTVTSVLQFAAMTAGVYAFASAINASIQSMAKMNDEATKLGMSVSTYMALSDVAGDLGVNIGGLTTAMGTITKQIEAARNGSEESAQSFTKLGLSAEKLSQMSPEGRFAAIAEAMSKMKDGTEKTALGLAIFGKQYFELVPVLELGAAGLADAVIEAQRLGQTFADIDVKNVKEAQVAMGDLGDTLKGVFNVAGTLIAPFISSVAKPFLDWAKETGLVFNVVRVGISYATSTMIGFGAALDGIVAVYNVMRTAIYGVLTAVLYVAEKSVEGWNYFLGALSDALNFVTKKINELTGSNYATVDFRLTGVQDTLNTLRTGLADATKEGAASVSQNWGKYREAAAALGAEFEAALNQIERRAEKAANNVADSLRNAGSGAKGKDVMFDTLEDALNALGIPTFEQIQAGMKNLKAYWDYAKREIQLAGRYNPELRYRQELEAINRLNDEKLLSDEQYTAAKLKLDEQLQRSQYDVFAATHKNQAILIEGFAGMADGMAKAIVAGESLGKAFKMAFKSMMADIAALILKAIFLNILYSMLGLVDASAGTRMAAGLANLTGMGTRAEGGPMQAGKPYLVGERGPELVLPNRDSYVIPNHELTGGGPRITVVQNIAVTPSVSTTVRNELLSAMPMIREQAIAGVAQATARGGGISSKIRGY